MQGRRPASIVPRAAVAARRPTIDPLAELSQRAAQTPALHGAPAHAGRPTAGADARPVAAPAAGAAVARAAARGASDSREVGTGERHHARACPFFLRGTCWNGSNCPYQH